MTETQPGREPEDEVHEQAGHATGLSDQDGRSGIDTSPGNDDLHGQAQEVAESSEGPGAARTPGA